MQRWSICRPWKQTGIVFAFLLLVLCCPRGGRAWGRSGHRLVVNKAIDTLPPEIRGYFESNRPFLSQHVTDPLDEINKLPAERRNHFIALDKYGRFPFAALPWYEAAVTNMSELDADDPTQPVGVRRNYEDRRPENGKK
jgi:hypothetical protein